MIDGLSPVQQLIVQAVILIVIGLSAAVVRWFGHKPEPPKLHSLEVVSGAFADRQSIKMLADAMERVAQHLEHMIELWEKERDDRALLARIEALRDQHEPR